MTGNGIVHEFGAVTLDVNGLESEAAFWSEMLGEQPGPVRSGGGWVTVGTLSGGTSLVLQKVPEPRVVKNRAHMCFQVTNVDEAISRIVELGGSQISEPRAGGGVTMADPEGNEFCIGAFSTTKEGVRTPL